jgi:hypothetical protein
VLGRYTIADPDICHGKPTFRGTRILVADVLDQVASGLAWETIIEEWQMPQQGGDVTLPGAKGPQGDAHGVMRFGDGGHRDRLCVHIPSNVQRR